MIWLHTTYSMLLLPTMYKIAAQQPIITKKLKKFTQGSGINSKNLMALNKAIGSVYPPSALRCWINWVWLLDIRTHFLKGTLVIISREEPITCSLRPVGPLQLAFGIRMGIEECCLVNIKFITNSCHFHPQETSAEIRIIHWFPSDID